MKIALCIIGTVFCLAITALASLFIKYCKSRMEEERLKDRVAEIENALADALTRREVLEAENTEFNYGHNVSSQCSEEE